MDADLPLIAKGLDLDLEDLRATDRRLQEIAALHKLVTENSRDAIINQFISK